MNNERNPYIQKEGHPSLCRSVVAFIDILGYTELVEEAEKTNQGQSILESLHEALSVSRKHVDPAEDYFTKEFLAKDDFAFRAFTDNIVIGYPIVDDGEIELGTIYRVLASVQTLMAIKGFFIRGAVSIGDLYMDDIVVFGNGLVQAYKGEQELARDPRIVLSPSAMHYVDHHLKYYGNRPHAPQNTHLFKDADGQYFINYLDATIEDEDGNDTIDLNIIYAHKEVIEKKLTRYAKTPAIWSKYMWSARYHNFFCKENKHLTTDDMLIDTNKISPEPSRIVSSKFNECPF